MADLTLDEIDEVLRYVPQGAPLRRKLVVMRIRALAPTVKVRRVSAGSWLIDDRAYFDSSASFAAALSAIVTPEGTQPGGNSLLVAIKARRRVLRKDGFHFLADAFDCFSCAGGLLRYRPRPTTPRVEVQGI